MPSILASGTIILAGAIPNAEGSVASPAVSSGNAQAYVDLSNLAQGDAIAVLVRKRVGADGSTVAGQWFFTGVQSVTPVGCLLPMTLGDFLESGDAIYRITVKQIRGVVRTFDYSIEAP